MTTSPGLQGLIERLEKCTGPDRELADDVLLACGWTRRLVASSHPKASERYEPPYYKWASAAGQSWPTIVSRPDPTASIDAALMLVPKTYNLSIGRTVHGFASADIWDPENRATEQHGNSSGSIAIALCIAALRARAATPTEAQ